MDQSSEIGFPVNHKKIPKKILILAANPKDTSKLRLDEETRDIKEGLRQAKNREQFIIESEWAVRNRDVRRAILNLKPYIVHFSGHGSKNGCLSFEDGLGQTKLIQPDALADLFELFSNHVKCVVLNACYSEVQANAISKHIEFVIGMNKEIGDLAAIEFSVGFYDAIGAGCSISESYKFGCNAIRMEGISEYLTPVLKKKESTLSKSSENLNPSSSKTELICHDNLLNQKKRYEFVLTGNIEEVNKNKLEALVKHLKEITGDASLTLLKIESGSVRLTFEGTEEGFLLLKSLVDSGEINQLLDMPIEALRTYDAHELDLQEDVSFVIDDDESTQALPEAVRSPDLQEPRRSKKNSPRLLELQAKVADRLYAPLEALQLLKETATAKFSESAEAHIRLGINPRYTDQQLRTTVILPKGTGETVRVAVIAQGENVSVATNAGADLSGSEELIDEIRGGMMDFDVLIATPDMMPKIARLGRLLGPRGLMPSPKGGTVTTDLPAAIKEFKTGKIEFRADRSGIVHVIFGKTSFPAEDLLTNLKALQECIDHHRPSGAKDRYWKSMCVKSTMGPSIQIDVNALRSPQSENTRNSYYPA